MSLFSLLSFYSFFVCLFCQHVSRQPPIKVFIVACHSKLYLLQATCDCHNNNATQCQTQMTSNEPEHEARLPACLSVLSVPAACLTCQGERQQVKVNCRVHSTSVKLSPTRKYINRQEQTVRQSV